MFVKMNQENGAENGAAAGGDEKNNNDNKAPSQEDYDGLKAQLTAFQESIYKLENNNKALMQEKIEAKKLAEKSAMDAAKKSGDVDAVEKSWSEKYGALEARLGTASQRYEGMIQSLTVGSAASKLAGDLAIVGSAEVLLPHISSRLTVEVKDDKPVVRVLDKEGRPSAMTIRELQAEFMADPRFAPIIAGTKASGSGFNGNRGNWGGGDGTKLITRAEYSSMDQSQKAGVSQHIRTGRVKIVETRQ